VKTSQARRDANEWYKQTHFLAGLCINCPRRNSRGTLFCELCLMKKRARSREYRLRKRRKG